MIGKEKDVRDPLHKYVLQAPWICRKTRAIMQKEHPLLAAVPAIFLSIERLCSVLIDNDSLAHSRQHMTILVKIFY